MEAWGGATYDVALRFLSEDPWERLALLREAMPNIPLQMLLRGRNTVGYTPYPTKVTDAFVAEAASTGLDIFRIFDSLNDVSQMRPRSMPCSPPARRSPRWPCATPATCSTPVSALHARLLPAPGRADRRHRRPRARHQGHGRVAARARRGDAGAALRERFDLPVHLHTHDTAGGQIGTLLAAIDAGVDAVDAACSSMAGTTSQPSLSALVAATDGTERPTGLDIDKVFSLEPYWEAVRTIYKPFESGLASPTGRVYFHEIPGGQLSNLRQQAIALGLGDRFEDIEDMYAAANRILGNIVKVTPSSKVVGDLALALVGAGADPADFEENPTRYDIPDSVIGFLEGELGDPPGGWPEPFRTKALQGRAAKPRHTELTPEQESALATEPRRTLNQLLFPGPTREFEASREAYGDLSVLGTIEFLHGLEQGTEYEAEIEAGKRLILGISSVGEADRQGMRTVMCTLNGQFRPVTVRDRSVTADVKAVEKADLSVPGHVPAPFSGVVTPVVAEGDTVEPGGVVATIEAMKMEANITSPVGGTVARLAFSGHHQQVEGGDLIVVVTPA
jgi:pyruvate carboxylase